MLNSSHNQSLSRDLVDVLHYDVQATIIPPELESKYSAARDKQTGVLEHEGVMSKCCEALRGITFTLFSFTTL